MTSYWVPFTFYELLGGGDAGKARTLRIKRESEAEGVHIRSEYSMQ